MRDDLRDWSDIILPVKQARSTEAVFDGRVNPSYQTCVVGEEETVPTVKDARIASLESALCKMTEERDAEVKRRAIAEAALAEARNRLSDGIAFAFNMMEPRTVEDTRDTLDEQLSVLEGSYKARGAALAAAREENERLKTLASDEANDTDELRDAIDEFLPDYVLDDGTDEPANHVETIEYAGDEIRRLTRELAALRSRADDDGRVERAVKAIEKYYEETPDEDHSDESLARAVLAAADGVEK